MEPDLDGNFSSAEAAMEAEAMEELAMMLPSGSLEGLNANELAELAKIVHGHQEAETAAAVASSLQEAHLMSEGSGDLVGGAEAQLVMGIAAMPVEIALLLAFFCFLFIVGFSGNLTVIVRIIRTQRQCRKVYGRDSGRRMTIQRYILLLACVDLIVTMMIPMLFPYLYSGQWLIGAATCKIFWVIDNINRLLSVHILTAMAIERYFIVRHSVNAAGNRRHVPLVATSLVYIVTTISLLLFIPLFSYVELDVIHVDGQTITTCVSPMPDWLYVSFIGYMFVLGYLIPALVVFACYFGLIRILKMRYKLTNMNENTKTQLVQKVTKSIICVTCFHFVIWTPFWAIILLPIINTQIGEAYPRVWMALQLLTLPLPYVNCSFNWCFYVLLNKRLRKQIFRAPSTYVNYNHNNNNNSNGGGRNN